MAAQMPAPRTAPAVDVRSKNPIDRRGAHVQSSTRWSFLASEMTRGEHPRYRDPHSFSRTKLNVTSS
jgi:hypothetical protein